MAGLLPLRHPRSVKRRRGRQAERRKTRATVCKLAFRGHYEYTLDAKNRLTVPAKFRAALSTGVVLAKSLETCISIWTPSGWDDFTTRAIKSRDPFSKEARGLQRYFHAGSFDAQLDSAGRIMLPPPLLRHAGLRKDVIVVGNYDTIEVWDREAWSDYERELDETASETAQRLAGGGQ
jgi:MraZ protein